MPESTARHPLLVEVQGLLERGGAGGAGLSAVLEAVLGHFRCATGTIHDREPDSGLLRLLAQRGIPEAIRAQVERIPVGKGMAGLAAERRQPVSVCNLQADAAGVARPGARETGMAGAIAVPMLKAGVVRGVLGVARPDAHEFSPAETALLQELADLLGQFLGREAAAGAGQPAPDATRSSP
jgi:GAF domain-containing protein